MKTWASDRGENYVKKENKKRGLWEGKGKGKGSWTPEAHMMMTVDSIYSYIRFRWRQVSHLKRKSEIDDQLIANNQTKSKQLWWCEM